MRLIAAMLILTLLSPAAVAMQQARAEYGDYWALLIQPDDRQQAVTALAQTLSDGYNFSPDRVIVLAGEQATIKQTHRAMGKISREFRRNDSLFIYLAVTSERHKNSLLFALADSTPQPSRSWLNLQQLTEWLSSLPTGYVLLSYPSCPDKIDWKDDEENALATLRYGKRAITSYDLLRVCYGQSSVAELTRMFSQQLQRLAQEWARPFSSHPLAAVSEELLNTIRINYTRIPEYVDYGFEFKPVPSDMQRYYVRYQEAADHKTRLTVLDELIAALAHDSSKPMPVEQAIVWLENIALSPLATLDPAPDEDSALLALRLKAVAGLERLANHRAARDSLNRIIQNAPNPASIRRAALLATSLLPQPSPADIAAARAALQDNDAQVREAAVRAVMLLQDKASAALLADMVANTDETAKVRSAALQGVVLLGGKTYQQTVLAVIEDEHEQVRREAIIALGELSELDKLSQFNGILLQALANDASEAVRTAAAFALGKIGRSQQLEQTVQQLQTALIHDTSTVASACAYALGELGDTRAVTALSAVLTDTQQAEELRIAVAEALGQLGSAEAVPALQLAAQDQQPGLRRAAATALSQLGSEQASAVLVDLLQDKDAYVSQAAVQGLQHTPMPDKALLANWNNIPAQVRSEVIKKLAASPEHIELILQALNDKERSVQQTAIKELVTAPWFNDAEVQQELQKYPVSVKQALRLLRGENQLK